MLLRKMERPIKKINKFQFVLLRIEINVLSLQKLFQDMAKEEFTKDQEQLARFAKALGHPVRVAILQMLAKQTCCYHGDMSEILPVAKSTLSQHLNELKEAGLIQGKITPPMVFYCINEKNWKLAKSLFNTLLIDVNSSENCC